MNFRILTVEMIVLRMVGWEAGVPFEHEKRGANGNTAHAPVFHCKENQAGIASLACLMIVPNMALSFMARSAIILRSNSIPASFTPCMNCE